MTVGLLLSIMTNKRTFIINAHKCIVIITIENTTKSKFYSNFIITNVKRNK